MATAHHPVTKHFPVRYVIVVASLAVVNAGLYFYSYLPCQKYIIESQPNLTFCPVTFTSAFALSGMLAIPYTTATITRFLLTKTMAHPVRARTFGRWAGVMTLIALIAGYFLVYR